MLLLFVVLARAFFLDVPVFHAAFAIQMLRVTRAGTILLQKVFSLRFTYSASLNFWSNFLFAEGIKSYYSYLELHANQGSKPEKKYIVGSQTLKLNFAFFFLTMRFSKQDYTLDFIDLICAADFIDLICAALLHSLMATLLQKY